MLTLLVNKKTSLADLGRSIRGQRCIEIRIMGYNTWGMFELSDCMCQFISRGFRHRSAMAKSRPKQFRCDVIAFDLTCIWFIRCPSSDSIMIVSQQEIVQFLQCWTEAPRMPGSHVFAGDALNKFSAPSDRSLTDKLARKHTGSEKLAPIIVLSQNQ